MSPMPREPSSWKAVRRRPGAFARARWTRSRLHSASPGQAIASARSGVCVEDEVRRQGFSVIRGLAGHGVGRAIHEAPSVPNYYEPRQTDVLTNGLVITIEPIICAGSERVVEERDGWTIRTRDGSLSAHHEHTIVITRDEPVILTAA